jgi:hypothetical protein
MSVIITPLRDRSFEIDPFSLLNLVYENQNPIISQQKINLQQVISITRNLNKIYQGLDRADTFQSDLARTLWRVRISILSTPLLFSEDILDFIELELLFNRARKALPHLRECLDEIVQDIKHLQTLASNPKLDMLKSYILNCSDEVSVGVFLPLVSSVSSRWSERAKKIIAGLDSRIHLIGSRKQLLSQSFDVIHVMGGLRFTPIPFGLELLYGGHAKSIHIIHYALEQLDLPMRPSLPITAPFYKETKPKPIQDLSDYEVPDTQTKIDSWVLQSYLDKIILHGQNNLEQAEELVPCRFILFTNNASIFIPADTKVIEVSDYFDGGMDLISSDLPKKSVETLEDDDLIVIRTAGGGEYVEVIADQLLAKAGKRQLRDSAMGWKRFVREAINGIGEEKFLNKFRENGGRVRNSAYLKEWAGYEVMSPRDQSDFNALLITANDFDLLDKSGPTAYAAKKWAEIQELKGFHHKAGLQIRDELLSVIKTELEAQSSILAELKISVPGIDGAEMSILRIAAIDSNIINVPSSQMYRLKRH